MDSQHCVLPTLGLKVWYHYGTWILPGKVSRVLEECRGLIDIELVDGTSRYQIGWFQESVPAGPFWSKRVVE